MAGFGASDGSAELLAVLGPGVLAKLEREGVKVPERLEMTAPDGTLIVFIRMTDQAAKEAKEYGDG